MCKLKKSFLILLLFFFIFSSKIFFMGSVGFEAKSPGDFINKVTLSSWTYDAEINTDQFLEISHAFIDMMTEWAGNDFLWINNEIPRDNKVNYISRNYSFCEACERRRGKTFLEFDYLLNYIAKWILPGRCKVDFIGDIHGDFYTIKEILLDMQNNDFINENMIIAKDYRIVFLGDYIDRGGFSLKVFATAMLLAAKNPGKVFLLRGNHEDICVSYNTPSYGFKTEIENIERDDFKRTSILNNLTKAFEFLLAALLVGYSEDDKFKCQLSVHGCPDIRLDYRRFSAVSPNDQANGVWLKEVSRDDFFTKTEFKKLIFEYLKTISNEGIDDFSASLVFDQKDVIAYFNNVCPIIGFLWNDISFDGDFADNMIKSSGRGDGLIRIHYNFIKYFFNKMSDANIEFVGIIRGHEHYLPKYILQLEQGLPRIPYLFYTPAVGLMFFGNYSIWCKTLQCNWTNPVWSSNFAVHTLISGCIVGEFFINYNPTYLEMEYRGSDVWLFTPRECCREHQNSGRLDLDL